MNKRTLSVVIMLIVIFGTLVFSPIGAFKAKEKLDYQKRLNRLVEDADASIAEAESKALQAARNFDSVRSFDVHYSDLINLNRVFEGVPGLEVQNITKLSPSEGFKELGSWQGEENTSAVKYDIVTSDIGDALTVLERMELPVYSIEVVPPNRLYVTILTGGDV